MDVQATLQGAKAPRPKAVQPIVVIGSGGIARDAHLPAYAKAGFPVAAIVDLDRTRAEALAKQYGIAAVPSTIAEAVRFAPKDAVFDVTVPAFALCSVLEQLPDGAAVLLQKPMGETLAEATEILKICRSKGLTAAVNFQLRWAPNMLMARALHDAGAVGDVHDVEVKIAAHQPWEIWTFLAKAPRLEILYHSIHYIDLVRSWFGNPLSVWAKTSKSPVTPELAATRSVVILDYGDSKRVYIHTNHGHTFSAAKQESFVQWEGLGGAMRARMGVNLDYPKGRPDEFEYILKGEKAWTNVPISGNWFPDAFMGSMGSLQAYVAGEAAVLPTSVEDAIDTMRTVEAAYLSSEQGGVPLPMLP
jgi:predicted dehydrogenase